MTMGLCAPAPHAHTHTHGDDGESRHQTLEKKRKKVVFKLLLAAYRVFEYERSIVANKEKSDDRRQIG